MADILYVQIFVFFLMFLLTVWAHRLAQPFSSFALVGVIMLAGVSLSNLWFTGLDAGSSELVMGIAQLLYWTGLIVGVIAFFAYAGKTLSDFAKSKVRIKGA